MKIFIAADHAGFELKEKVRVFLMKAGHDVVDCGAEMYDKNDDYPDFIGKAAKGVSQDPDNSFGVVFGGSGQAEMMTANKFRNVRCALFYSLAVPVGAAEITGRMSTDPYEIIRLAREHNNANMLSLSGRFLKDHEVIKAIESFIETRFPADERHVRRIEKIKKIEENK